MQAIFHTMAHAIRWSLRGDLGFVLSPLGLSGMFSLFFFLLAALMMTVF